MLCGLSRLSGRSLIATSVIFGAAAIIVGLFPRVTGNSLIPSCGDKPCYTLQYPSEPELRFMISVAILAPWLNFFLVPKMLQRSTKSKTLFSYLAGIQFGLGLLMSGMADPVKVVRFFALFTEPSKFDPSLALMFPFAIGPSLLGYLITKPTQPPSNGGREKPTLAESWVLHQLTVADIDWRFVVGGIIFGVGFGLTGACPGPSILRLVLQPLWGAAWMSGYILGNII
jgi:uncharacterized protein